MTKRKLSICIPTYNRGKYIYETIASALEDKSVLDCIEIIISDNASQDETEKVVKEFQYVYSNITYYKWAENMGPDRNFLKVIELANGEFCWFVSSDDKIEKGAVKYILDTISNNNLSGITVNRRDYNNSFSMPANQNEQIPEDRLFDDADQCINDLCVYFGYISGQIVNRELWLKVVGEEDVQQFYNCYVHVYVIMRMILLKPQWLFLSYPCVGYRYGNDSFLSGGYIKRLNIDIIGYSQIAEGIYGQNIIKKKKILNRILGTHIFSWVAQVFMHKHTFYDRLLVIRSTLPKYWWSEKFWLKIIPLIFSPRWCLLLIKKFK